MRLHSDQVRTYGKPVGLGRIASSSPNGSVCSSADTTELSRVFVEIAGGAHVAGLFEAEIGKRVSEAVSDKVALEFLR
jgi:hypothetical protein